MAPKKRQTWDKDSMAMAILAIREKKMGFLKASKTFSVPKITLIRLSKKNADMGIEDVTNIKLGRKATLPAKLEADLAAYVLELESLGFGLTRRDIKSLAFQIAQKNNISHPFSKENEAAGKTWLRLFLRRHPELSFRQPTGTSIARLKGFNKERVQEFYSLLENAVDKHKFTPNNIFNVDETGISVVPNKMPEVLAKRGKKSVVGTTSAERGATITCVMCMSASGSFIPPMMIFPRKRDHPLLMRGAPPGAIHACHPSGWIQTDLFTKWFKHFLQHAKPSQASPVLLILDGHASHTRNIELIDLARENHVHLLSLPPHSSHKMQPLDRTFMGPLKKYLSEEIRQWMRSKTQVATQYDIAEVFGRAYIKAQRAELAINGFRVTGICPIDRNVFQDHDFINDADNDEPIPARSRSDHLQSVNTPQPITLSGEQESESIPSSSRSDPLQSVNTPQPITLSGEQESEPIPSCSRSDPLQSVNTPQPITLSGEQESDHNLITAQVNEVVVLRKEQDPSEPCTPVNGSQLTAVKDQPHELDSMSTDNILPITSHIRPADTLQFKAITIEQECNTQRAAAEIKAINKVKTLAQLALAVILVEEKLFVEEVISNEDQTGRDATPLKLTSNEVEVIAGPSTYFSPKQLFDVPRLIKKSSNRGRKSGKSTLLTSSPYKLNLETSIKSKQEAELLQKTRSLAKELKKSKKKETPKKNAEPKRKMKKTDETPKKKNASKKQEVTKNKTATKRKPKEKQKVTKKTAQKKRKTTRKHQPSSSEEDHLSVNDDTDDSDDENAKCLYCFSSFSDDTRGEQWIQCPSCHRWAHEECAGVDGVSFLCEYCHK